jgi:hypothetical protein
MPELVLVAALSEDQSVTVYATSTGTKYQPPQWEETSMKVIIDRFEGDFAVCEKEDR